MRFSRVISLCLVLSLLAACSQEEQSTRTEVNAKPVVYQVFTRLFGNKNTSNKPWGSRLENGVGKFNDFDDVALAGIKELGVTHIWFTGVPRHAVMGDYTDYGIPKDDPDVIKGPAGSPYAVTDYYDVNPDLALDPANRLDEFKAMIKRVHSHDMKVVIDIVPNHVARGYKSIMKPAGVVDFGAKDDTSKEYTRTNDFYYIPNTDFKVPVGAMQSGQLNMGQDGLFYESPAKWTGNGSRQAQPDKGDWYETVKVNYGVRPDGSYDFAKLPASFADKGPAEHIDFWQKNTVPPSWNKFRQITQYWLDMGVYGFRYDMAEMVPVEFWSYLNSHIKAQKPDAFLLAEIYQPHLYRDFIQLGKTDYLYDKEGLYTVLRKVVEGAASTDDIPAVHEESLDIKPHMLHFLENQDEQRIASSGFAGNPIKALPAMVVSTLIGGGPTMIYFGQEVGEAAELNSGFGDPTRTSIFDYAGVPNHQRWMNGGAFDGGGLSQKEKALRQYYKTLLNISNSLPSLKGGYVGLHRFNRENTKDYDGSVFSFARSSDEEVIVVVSNFSEEKFTDFSLKIPASKLGVLNGDYNLSDQLSDQQFKLTVVGQNGHVDIKLKPLQSVVLRLSR